MIQVPCLKEAIAKVNCDLDMQCICPKTTQEAIRKDATSCVLKVCAPSDLAKAQKAAVNACATFTLTQTGAKTHSATTISSPVSTSAAGAASREPSVALIGAILAIAAFPIV